VPRSSWRSGRPFDGLSTPGYIATVVVGYLMAFTAATSLPSRRPDDALTPRHRYTQDHKETGCTSTLTT
jgi:hypothetical protein